MAPMPGFSQTDGGGEGESTESTSDGETAGESGESSAKSKPSGPTPELFLLPTAAVGDITSIVPERIGEMLRDRVSSNGKVDLQPSFEQMQKSASSGGGGVNAAIAEARKKYTSGIGLLEAGNHEKASDALQKAVDQMKENIGDLKNFDILSDALAKLARAYFEAGYDFDARKRMKEYAHLKPETSLDPKKYPKELRDIYQREAKKVDKGGTGTLKISSNVEGAEVFIDGKKKGETPVDVTDVGFGYHYLVVKSPSGGTWSQQLQVRARGATQKYNVELGSAAQAARAKEKEAADSEMPAFYTELQSSIGDGSFGTDLQPYLEELTKRTGADYIAWVVMVKGETSYEAAPFVYRVEDGLFVQAESVSFNYELSNLMVGVNDLSTELIETVETMPEEKAITSVSLGEQEEEEEKVAAAGATGTKETSESSSTQSSEGSTAEGSETSDSKSVKPPPPVSSKKDDDSKGNAMTYVGIGGAALLVGGLVAGGAVLLSGDKGSTPPGFTAEVTW